MLPGGVLEAGNSIAGPTLLFGLGCAQYGGGCREY
jgi:hypothetical protein